MKISRQITFAILVLVASSGVAAALVYFRREPEKQGNVYRPLEVEVKKVDLVEFPINVSSQGTVRPRTTMALVSEVAGRIVSVAPDWDDGSYFEEGDVLLAIDDREYALAKISAAANVAQAELRLAREEQEAEAARREWEELGNKDSPPDLVLHLPQLNEARAAVRAAEASRDRAVLDFERAKLLAPFAGRILEKRVDRGQYVTRGSVVARLYAIDFAEVRLPIADGELAYLNLPLRYRGDSPSESGAVPPIHEGSAKIGSTDVGLPEVILTAEFAGKKHTWRGRIVRTEGEIDPKSRRVHIVARVEDPYGRGETPGRPPLASGLFVQAKIRGRTLRDIFVVPRHALRNDDKILIVDNESRLQYRRVRVIRHMGERSLLESRPVEVALNAESSAEAADELPYLEAGELICTTAITIVVPGMRVATSEGKIASPSPAADAEPER